jgi:hypothetical protein
MWRTTVRISPPPPAGIPRQTLSEVLLSGDSRSDATDSRNYVTDLCEIGNLLAVATGPHNFLVDTRDGYIVRCLHSGETLHDPLWALGIRCYGTSAVSAVIDPKTQNLLKLLVLNPATGQVLTQHDFGEPVRLVVPQPGDVAAWRQEIVQSTDGTGRVGLVDLVTGEATPLAQWRQGPAASPLFAYEHVVYLLEPQGRMVAFDPAKGQVVWVHELPNVRHLRLLAIDAQRVLYSAEQDCFLLNLKDGSIAWQKKMPRQHEAPSARLCGEMCLIETSLRDGLQDLHCPAVWRTDTGEVLFQFPGRGTPGAALSIYADDGGIGMLANGEFTYWVHEFSSPAPDRPAASPSTANKRETTRK